MLKKLLGALLILIACLLGLLWLSRNALIDRALLPAKAHAAQRGLVFDYAERNWSIRTLTLRGVKLDGLWGRVPVSVRLDELHITPHWLSLISGAPGLDLYSKMYRGEVRATASTTWNFSNVEFSGFVDRLEVSDYPMIRAAGIDRGQLSLQVPNLRINPSEISGTFNLQLIRLGKSTPTEIRQGLPAPIKIPAFERLNFDARGGITSKAIIVRPLELTSDFGTLGGNMALNLGRPVSLEGQGSAALTALGQQVLGPWLPVLSNGKVSENSTGFNLLITQTRGNPEIRMTPR